MTPTCIDACVICDIDGYTGINDDPQKGQAPQGFCTTTAHHMQWIAFIAGSANLTITVTPSGCRMGTGLEVGIYESLDCNTFRLVSNCNGDIAPGQTGIFTNTQPLVVGQYYYFVMDGNAGDVCSYTIRVTQGSTKVPPLPPTGAITGPAEVCQSDTMIYSVPAILGANFYEWRLNGKLVATGPEAEIAFPDAGTFQVCATAYNVCDTAAPSCTTVRVLPAEKTDLTEEICQGECIEIAGARICDPGNYTFHLSTVNGCDSTVNVSVSRIPTVSSELSATICSTDSLYVGDSWYRPPGRFVEIQQSVRGCDSLINLTLNEIICEITGNTQVKPILCHGARTGALTFSVRDGTPPFTYAWERLGGGPSGDGNLAALNRQITFEGLPAGTYLIRINDTFGNDAVLTAVVPEPPPLSTAFELSDFNGFNVDCAGGRNGVVTASPRGGTPPYAFLWSSGSRQPALSGIPAGTYGLTVTDAVGCVFPAQTMLAEPLPLDFSAQFSNPGCDGYNTGSVTVQGITGGVAPYRFSLSDGGLTEETVFSGLTQGRYALTAVDANGCKADTSARLIAAHIPTLDIDHEYLLKLGYEQRLRALVDIVPKSVRWTPDKALSCTDCLEPVATPLETTVYTVVVASKDGCMDTDSVTVRLLNTREVFAPNAFSPNDDGVNDSFTVFGDVGLSRVKVLKVFSRWGELVFERYDFPPNDPNYGWNGSFRGKPMESGVFAWLAEVEFLDGRSVLAEGDVSIVK